MTRRRHASRRNQRQQIRNRRDWAPKWQTCRHGRRTGSRRRQPTPTGPSLLPGCRSDVRRRVRSPRCRLGPVRSSPASAPSPRTTRPRSSCRTLTVRCRRWRAAGCPGVRGRFREARRSPRVRTRTDRLIQRRCASLGRPRSRSSRFRWRHRRPRPRSIPSGLHRPKRWRLLGRSRRPAPGPRCNRRGCRAVPAGLALRPRGWVATRNRSYSGRNESRVRGVSSLACRFRSAS